MLLLKLKGTGEKMIKNNDFIEIDYTGFTSDGQVFDTTKKDVAKKHGFKDAQYAPLIICVGRAHILRGLDAKLDGLKIGTHKIPLTETEAFGKKDPKKLKLMPMKLFQKENIRPFVGLELNIDDQLGTVRNISGGRVIVDFNHPLAGKPVSYEVEIKRKVEDKKEMLEGLLKVLSIPVKNVQVDKDKAKITTAMEIPKQLQDIINKEIELTINIKAEFDFEKPKENKKV